MKLKTLYSLLIFAGVIPFTVAALAPFFGAVSLPLVGAIDVATALYMLVIVSFMSGIHWGLAINTSNTKIDNRQAKGLMLASNIYTIVPWACYLLLGISVWLYASLALAFILILATDAKLQTMQVISEHYYRSRRLVTVIVVICLILIVLNS